MNRKLYTGILAAIVCLTFGLLTGCSSSSKTYTVTTASGASPQSQTVNEAFPAALAVNVTSGSNPASGVTVTFSAPSSGQTCTLSSTTATTDANGNASVTCTANGTPGTYTVSAAVSSSASASFDLTNAAPSVFVFYVSGQELTNPVPNGPNFYAIAGAVAFDLSGNVLGGEQDYNDGFGLTSPGEPTTADALNAATSSLSVDTTTGTGTAILDFSATNPNVGAAGIETFAIQFANSSHGIITQFDGSATSSGSFDLQTNVPVAGNFAFTMSGWDSSEFPVAYGGIFADAGGATANNVTGTVDENDANTGQLTGTAFTVTDNGVPSTDAYGRGSISGFTDPNTSAPISLVYYIVGAEAVRIIDVDTTDSAVGSAYGQGSTLAFDSTALGAADVFGLQTNSAGFASAAAGSVLTAGSASGTFNATFTGEGDEDDQGALAIPTAASTPNVAGNYSFDSSGDGYGNITGMAITGTGTGAVTTLQMYATDPTLNILDPNNTSGGGGALLLDMDATLAGSVGFVVPQGTVATDGSDLNNSYGFGQQILFGCSAVCEYDYVGQGTFASLVLTGTVNISDPELLLDGTDFAFSDYAFGGTATGPDSAGRYSLPVSMGPLGTNTSPTDLTLALYEATGSLVVSIDEDAGDLGIGTYQVQSSSSLRASHFKRGIISKKSIKKSHR